MLRLLRCSPSEIIEIVSSFQRSQVLRLTQSGTSPKSSLPVSVACRFAVLSGICLGLNGCGTRALGEWEGPSDKATASIGVTKAAPVPVDAQHAQASNIKQASSSKRKEATPKEAVGASTMRGAVESAIRHSAEIQAADAKKAEAGINISIAKSGYLPTLQSSAGTGSSTDYQVSLAQPIYDFGQTSSKVRQATAGELAAGFEVRATKEDISLKSAQAFIAIKRYEALVQAAREDISVHERFVRLASTRAEGGIADSTEVQLANVHLGEAQSALEDAEGYLRAARSTYHSYVGLEAGALGEIPELQLDLSRFNTLEASITDAPTVKLAQARVDEAQGAVDAEKASLYPRISAETFYRGGSDYSRDKTGIGIRLTGPTFNGFSNFQRVEAMRKSVDSSEWAAEAAKRDINLKIKELTDRTPTLRNQIGILSMQQEKAKELRRLYEEQFKMGERSFLDLINVQNDVVRLERSKINAGYDLFDLQYSAAAALGVLQQKLDISE